MKNNFQSHRWCFLKVFCLSIIGALVAFQNFAAPTDDVYLLGPDSAPHEGVPRGQVFGPLTLASDVFTNTTRHYWIYVPAQYDRTKPACLMIFQDGHAFLNTNGDYRVPYVFDNLIYRREMPVTIGSSSIPATHRHSRNPVLQTGAMASTVAPRNTTN
ncbi:MAG: hypothetical protein WDN00_03385 [Limisphaerales bacterium]